MEQPADIQKLLRLKRYELPPESYYEDFLQDFQERQRAEMLKVSIWTLAWDRFCNLMPDVRIPKLAYASIAVAGLAASLFILQDQPASELASGAPSESAHFTLTGRNPVTIAPSQGFGVLPTSTSSVGTPQYIIQSRPASYDSPLSF